MPTLRAGLINENTRVPAAFVEYEGETHLFDCGRVNFSRKFIHRLRNVCVSHMHMDHFCDFDGVLAYKLKAPQNSFNIFGPPGIADSVKHKIRAYTWNLAPPGSIRITVREIGESFLSECELSVPDDIDGSAPKTTPIENDCVFKTEGYALHAVSLNHGIPSIAYAFKEHDGVSVSKDKLSASGLKPGPWLGELKWQATGGNRGPIQIDGVSHAFDEMEDLLEPYIGKKIVYLTDFALDADTLELLAGFARDADQVICESNYSDEHTDLAKVNYHLTAGQAGQIASAANAKELLLFHFSAKFDRQELIEQAKAFYDGTVK